MDFFPSQVAQIKIVSLKKAQMWILSDWNQASFICGDKLNVIQLYTNVSVV